MTFSGLPFASARWFLFFAIPLRCDTHDIYNLTRNFALNHFAMERWNMYETGIDPRTAIVAGKTLTSKKTYSLDNYSYTTKMPPHAPDALY